VPKDIPLFKNLPQNEYICEIVCGSNHTVALTTKGRVFTWGNNDDCALGREGEQKFPDQVILPVPITDITAGDCHTIAYNKNLNLVYFWGKYRVITSLLN
jgi:alpha-tubulin suppressor-like RCC1 family protein